MRIGKRLGIFCLYSPKHKVEADVLFLLKNMKMIFSDLVIVINHKQEYQGENKLEFFSKKIIHRDNIGYDGGAYQDVILNHLNDIELKKYDELVLFNDTFFAPLCSWNEIFGKLSLIDVDFWGLSRSLKTDGDVHIGQIDAHVQAYFIVIRKKMFTQKSFLSFWQQMDIASEYYDAIKNFEIAFTNFFVQRGFKYTSWIDVVRAESLLKPGENVYAKQIGALVCKHHFPIIKKKTINLAYFAEFYKAYCFFRKYSKFPLHWLDEYFHSNGDNDAIFSLDQLGEFYYNHKNIFVFGHGMWGRNMEAYFKYEGWEIKGIVVSKKKSDDGTNIIELKDFKMEENDGLIIALEYETYYKFKYLFKGINGAILQPKNR